MMNIQDRKIVYSLERTYCLRVLEPVDDQVIIQELIQIPNTSLGQMYEINTNDDGQVFVMLHQDMDLNKIFRVQVVPAEVCEDGTIRNRFIPGEKMVAYSMSCRVVTTKGKYRDIQAVVKWLFETISQSIIPPGTGMDEYMGL